MTDPASHPTDTLGPDHEPDLARVLRMLSHCPPEIVAMLSGVLREKERLEDQLVELRKEYSWLRNSVDLLDPVTRREVHEWANRYRNLTLTVRGSGG